MFKRNFLKLAILLFSYLVLLSLLDRNTWIIGSVAALSVILALSLIPTHKNIWKILKINAQILSALFTLYLIYNKNIDSILSFSDFYEYYKASMLGAVLQIEQSAIPVVLTSQLSLVIGLSISLIGIIVVNTRNKIVSTSAVIVPGIFATVSTGTLGSALIPLITITSVFLMLLLSAGAAGKFSKGLTEYLKIALVYALSITVVVTISSNLELVKPPVQATAPAGKVAQIGLEEDPIVSMQRLLLNPQKRIILEYEGPATYFKAATLEYFDGDSWSSRTKDMQQVPNLGKLNEYEKLEKTTINLRTFGSKTLPVPYNTSMISVTYPKEIETLTVNADDETYTLDTVYSNKIVGYSVLTYQNQEASALENVAKYQQIPANINPEVKEIAQEITADYTSSTEKVEALTKWFKKDGGFTYSTGVIGTYSEDLLMQFLQEKIGYCAQYAGAFAIMARLLNIPSRVVVGYTYGEYDPSRRISTVTTKNAHAWVEVWIEGKGWMQVDPTPSYAVDPEPEPVTAVEIVESGVSAPAVNVKALQEKIAENFVNEDQNVEVSSDGDAFKLMEITSTRMFAVLGVILLLILIVSGLAFRKYSRKKVTKVELYHKKIAKKLGKVNLTPHEIGVLLYEVLEDDNALIKNWVQQTEKYLYHTGLTIDEELYIQLSKNVLHKLRKSKALKVALAKI